MKRQWPFALPVEWASAWITLFVKNWKYGKEVSHFPVKNTKRHYPGFYAIGAMKPIKAIEGE